jgi:hypothetical protein
LHQNAAFSGPKKPEKATSGGLKGVMMAKAAPSTFAGHGMPCPYDCNFKFKSE